MSFALPKIIVSSDAISLCFFLRNVTIFCHHLFFAMPKRYFVDIVSTFHQFLVTCGKRFYRMTESIYACFTTLVDFCVATQWFRICVMRGGGKQTQKYAYYYCAYACVRQGGIISDPTKKPRRREKWKNKRAALSN